MYEKPMLPIKSDDPFDSDAHIFEPMIEGQRLRVVMENGVVTLYSRHGFDVTMQYPELLRVPLTQPADVVLDGEAVCLNPATGKADPGKLQARYRTTNRSRIRDAAKETPITWYAFDILSLNGADIRSWPLLERKKALRDILEENAFYKHLPYVEREGAKLFRLAGLLGLEGIVGKNKHSFYREGRSPDWLAVKNNGGQVPM